MLRRVIAKNAKYTHQGTNAVVVGGTSGIGEGIALRLAKAKFNVTISGRNKVAGEKILEEMSKLHPGNHKFIPCDVQLMENCFKSFGSTDNDPLGVLVLCQGIGTVQGRTETKEGIDQKLALHYYSRMACILALLPRLLKADNPKVLSVFSAGIHSPYELYQEDPELKKHYSLVNAANAPGFYNDLALDALSRLHPKVNFTHIAPGVVSTNVDRNLPLALRILSYPVRLFSKTPADCAELMCQGLLQESKPGFYLLDQYGQPTKQTKLHTDEAREFIWKHTTELLSKFQ